MSKIVVTTELPPQQTTNTGLNLDKLLLSEKTIHLEFLKQLSNNTVQFKSHYGLINLKVSDSNQFKQSTNWILHNLEPSKGYTLEPAIVDIKSVSKNIQQQGRINAEVIAEPHNNIVTFKSSIGDLKLAFNKLELFSVGSQWKLTTEGSKLIAQNISDPNIRLEAKPVFPHPHHKSQDIQSSQPRLDPTSARHSSLRNVILSQKLEAFLTQGNLTELFAHLVNPNFKNLLTAGNVKNADHIQKLAELVLNLRLSSPISQETLQSAIRQSGVFNKQGSISSQRWNLPLNNSPQNQNIHQLLLNFKQLLVQNNENTQTTQSLTRNYSPSTTNTDVTEFVGQRPYKSTFGDLTAQTISTRMTEMVDQALSRIKLLQLSSSTEMSDDLITHNSERNKTQIVLELPIALTNEETAIAALRISKEGGQNNTDDPYSRKWAFDISLDTEETGAITANITLKSKSLNITIWAENRDFTALLQNHSEEFKAHLAIQGLNVHSFKILYGKPPLINKNDIREGSYLDQSI